MSEKARLSKEEWISKILRPLEFVSRNNFANLSKTKGLEKTLLFLINQAPEEVSSLRKRLLELCTGLDSSSFKEKIEKTKENIANGISDKIKPEIDKAINDAINKNKGE